jgi:hypothetical protein
MKASYALIVFALLLWPAVGRTTPSGAPIQLFNNEQQAHQHCPADAVVWLNTAGVYHFKGQRFYANNQNGSFVCMHEADRAGYRPARNGE